MADIKAPIAGVLLDMDGVLYIDNQLIPGANATLVSLRERGIPLRFITNTTTTTAAQLVIKLGALGLDVQAGEIFSAVRAAADYLAVQGKPTVHLAVADTVRDAFADFPADDVQPDYVVIGDIGTAWNYALLNRLFNMLMGGSQLLCMHRNRYWQTEGGLRMDIGAFVAGLEYTSGKQAIVVGKPARDFFLQATASLQLPASSVAIVGDDIEADIGGGMAAGLLGILVRTGKYREEQANKSPVRPDAIIDSIADLPALVE